MRQLLIVILTFITLSGIGQTFPANSSTSSPNTLQTFKGGLRSDSGLIISKRDTINHPARGYDGTLTLWHDTLWMRVQPKWVKVSGGSGGGGSTDTANISYRIDTLATLFALYKKDSITFNPDGNISIYYSDTNVLVFSVPYTVSELETRNDSLFRYINGVEKFLGKFGSSSTGTGNCNSVNGTITHKDLLRYDVVINEDYSINCVTYPAISDSVTLAPSHPSLDRVDVVYADTSNHIGVQTGVPGTDVITAGIDNTYQVLIGTILVKAGSTSPSDSVFTIYDEGTVPPEADTASTLPNKNFRYTATTPYSKTRVISTGSFTGGQLEFTFPSAKNANDYDALTFWVKLADLTSPINFQGIQAYFFYNGQKVGNMAILTPRPAAFNFGLTNDTAWHKVSIPMSVFGTTFPIDKLRLYFARPNTDGIFIDLIQLQGGNPTATDTRAYDRMKGDVGMGYALNNTSTFEIKGTGVNRTRVTNNVMYVDGIAVDSIWTKTDSIVYRINGTTISKKVLVTAGGSGTVTSISQGYGITNSPNPITTTGEVKADSTVIASKTYVDNKDALKADKTTTVAGFPLSGNVTLANLTPGIGLLGSTYNGSTARTFDVDTANVATKTYITNNYISSGNGWLTTGNTATGSPSYFIGTTSNNSFRIRTNNLERVIVDSATGNVGIGTSTPTVKLQIEESAVQINSTGAGAIGYNVTTYGNNTTAGQNVFIKAGGTATTPTATLNGYSIGSFSFRGHNGTALTGSKGFLFTSASEDWTPTANGTRMRVQLTPNGSTSLATILFLDHNGNVGLGGSTPLSKLSVNGGAAIGSSYYATTAAPTNGLIVEGSAGLGTSSPNASALLDMTSTTKGLLIPRGTTTQLGAIGSPAPALMFWTTTDSTLNMNRSAAGTSFYQIGAWYNPSNESTITSAGGGTGNATTNRNSFYGKDAGLGNTSGGGNTAVGHSALKTNTIQGNNTAVGYQSIQNGTGQYNTAVGSLSQLSTGTSSQNSSLGYQSLGGTISGAANTAVGYQSMPGSHSGSNNTAIGAVSFGGSTNSGSNCLAIGYRALYNGSNGDNNVAIGAQAMNGVDAPQVKWSGSYSTALGVGAMFNILQKQSAVGSTAIGSRAYTTRDHQMTFGDSSLLEVLIPYGNVSIGGTMTAILPTSTLQVAGSFAPAYISKTTTYTATAADHTIDCTGGGTFTVTLPTAVGITGREYFITNSGAGVITVATTSGQTFTNVTATPTTLTVTGLGGIIVQSTGTNWLQIK